MLWRARACSSKRAAGLAPPATWKSTGGNTINLPGSAHRSAAAKPTARFWSVGIEMAALGKPASAIRGKNTQTENRKKTAIRPKPASLEEGRGGQHRQGRIFY